jgi:hypothetical protein
VEITPGIGDPREFPEMGTLNRNNAMRETEVSGWMVRGSSRAPVRTLRLGALGSGVVLGLTLVMTAGAARAGDDDRSFTERFVDGFKDTIRGNTMDNRGIDYRERSPLVVPPNLDLPPPVTASKAPQVTNWPKDPDEKQRKAIIAAKKKNAPPVVAVAPASVADAAPRPINIAPPVVEAPAPTPDTIRPAHATDSNGTARTDPVYDQAGDLFRGGASSAFDNIGLGGLNNLFGGKKDDPSLPPGTEPAREALTQPPSGYQTPSASYPYAVAPKSLLTGETLPDRPPPGAQSSSASSVVH